MAGKSAEVYSTRVARRPPRFRELLSTLGKTRLTLWGPCPRVEFARSRWSSRSSSCTRPEKLDLDLTLRRRADRDLVDQRQGGSRSHSLSRIRTIPRRRSPSWIVSLPSKGTTLLIDCWGRIFRDDPFRCATRRRATRKGPRVFLACIALEGTPTIRSATETASLMPVPGSAFLSWTPARKNKFETAAVTELPADLRRQRPKPSPELVKVRKNFRCRPFAGKAPDLALSEPDQVGRSASRRAHGRPAVSGAFRRVAGP